MRAQNDVVLDRGLLIQNDAVLNSHCLKRRSFNMWLKKKKNDVVFVSIVTKRRRFAGFKILICKSPSSSSSGIRKKSERGRRRGREEEVPAPGEEEEEHICGRRRWFCTLSWSAPVVLNAFLVGGSASALGCSHLGIFDRQLIPFNSPIASLRGGNFFKKSKIRPLLCIFLFMIGCIYIVVCDLNLKIMGIALFGSYLIFQIFFLLFVLNLNPNGHIIEAKMEIFII